MKDNSDFKIIQSKVDGKTVFRIIGAIDEESNFQNIKLPNTSELIIDLHDVTMMNSCGTRNWVKWVRQFPPNLYTVFINCPRTFIDQANMIDGFFPKKSIVSSFFVPYFCENCKNSMNILLHFGKEVTGVHIEFPEAEKCNKCGGKAELDIIESTYFKFLAKLSHDVA